MTMEMVESQPDDNAVDSVPERDAGHLQNQPGRSEISRGSEVSVAASSAGRVSPAVMLVQLPSGQTVHAQGVIQATQPSVIQSPHMLAVQVRSFICDSAPGLNVILGNFKRKRTCENTANKDAPAIPKIEEEEKSEDEGAPSGISPMAMSTSLYHTNTGQYITITQGGTIQISNPASDGVHGLQTLAMTNSGAPQPGATIVQYAGQSPDGTQQFFVPGSQVVVQAATGDMPAYQLRTPTTTLPQGVVMAASPGTLHSPQQLAEEATRKRELRLMKNREAAKECRRRKKEYIKCLESRVAVLEVQNKKLVEELETLKDICSSKTD
ncbi:CREM protein, partial [Herpetotheres cachinnans]|nr:CREM protein [Herpetotheres cachinnans]